MNFFATTAKGMEALLATELRALGAGSVEERRAGCAFEGPLAVAYRACLWSRVASRVLLPLATFPSEDADALYAGARAIPWADHLAPRATLAVDFASSESAIAHTHFGALRTKDAIVDRLRDETGARPSIDTARPDVRVNVHLHRDVATVSIDLSGESLHRRGYRAEGSPAPLKESLAAAILLLADWPAIARAGAPLLDPMCGSGTLPIEAALIAGDVAPGLSRNRFGFHGWRGHEASTWAQLVAEARARAVRDPSRLPPIVGRDVDERALRLARQNVERAGLRDAILLERCALDEGEPPAPRATLADDAARGLLVANPPYGERLGDERELGPLYAQLGDVLRRRYPGWRAAIFTGNAELAKHIGLRAARRHPLWNGAIECRLLEYPIAHALPKTEGPGWRKPWRPRAESEGFRNRLVKNLRHLRKWARREDVHCFRVYDADLPEYAVAVDLYERFAHVQEYAPPKEIEPAVADARLRDAIAIVPEALGVAPDDVFVKVRRRQRAGAQYERLGEAGVEHPVREGGHRFLVNLGDYLDTGLFLDHRRLRAMVGELAPGRRFLNLFCYTGSATVYAAKAGARATTSVDLSNTYLEWARRNLDLNSVLDKKHELIRADCLPWLAEQDGARRFELILVAPPTFSNSKGMAETFDVQRDHVALLASAARLLAPGGVLLFSNNLRRFRMDAPALLARDPALAVEEITRETIPPDFARNPRIHSCWRLTRR